MFVRQDRIEAEVLVCGSDGWSARTLTDPAAPLEIPEIGIIGTLADLYSNTPLAVQS
jgi:hypothetical protein